MNEISKKAIDKIYELFLKEIHIYNSLIPKFCKDYMACDCKDANGSLMEYCLGTCHLSKMEQYYSQKLIDCEEGMTNLLKQFRCNLEQIERDVAQAFRDMYVDGFRKGFEMAKEIYE